MCVHLRLVRGKVEKEMRGLEPPDWCYGPVTGAGARRGKSTTGGPPLSPNHEIAFS